MVKRDFKGVFIPKDIWFDTSLTPTEMKLLAEVNSLDKGDGAYASNAHYADIVGRSARQIQNLLKELQERGLITSEGDGKSRRLFSNHEVYYQQPRSELHPNHETGNTPTTKPTSPEVKQLVEQGDKATKEAKPKSYYPFLIRLYRSLYEKELGVAPVINNHGKNQVLLKPLIDNFTQVQATAIMFAHFDWRGIDGKDDFAHGRIKNAGFPLSWIGNGISNYVTYLKNTAGVNFDSEEELKPVVEAWLKKL